MPFAFVSDNASFPFQSQGLINLFLNWKFCLSTCFLRTQLSGHRKTKAMAASAGHSTFESVAFLSDSLPWQKGQKADSLLKPPLSGTNSDREGRVPSTFALPHLHAPWRFTFQHRSVGRACPFKPQHSASSILFVSQLTVGAGLQEATCALHQLRVTYMIYCLFLVRPLRSDIFHVACMK